MYKDMFITGTDTGVGKTIVTCALLSHLAAQGKTVQGMKPVASGCRRTVDGLRNEDAELLMRYSSLDLPYASVNPYAYTDAVAPHLLIEESGGAVDFELIRRQYTDIAAACDHTLVEGVGGWLVPLGKHVTVADLARSLGLPVLLVVGMRLGCINHALLTYQAIVDAGLLCAGWVANRIDAGMQRFDANVEAIRERIPAPLLGVLPFDDGLDIPALGSRLSLLSDAMP